VLLKRRQDGFGSEGDLYVHGLMHSVRVLTDGSGETASTPKIVSDVARKPLVRSGPVRLASASAQAKKKRRSKAAFHPLRRYGHTVSRASFFLRR
jgi:hypothetical protein